MRERRYLLDIGQMLEDGGGEDLFREAFDRIDRERRQKVLSLKNVRAQAAGIGAGLLIQKALADHMADCRTECQTALKSGRQPESWTAPQPEYQPESRTEPGIEQSGQQEPSGDSRASGQQGQSGDSMAALPPSLECFSVRELLAVLGRRVTEACYRYGKGGKPYLAERPFLFNLSHSGDYVFCGVSGREIGVDIQKIQRDKGLRLAKRFFAAPECRALEACGDEELRRRMFFRMWVRKEAYGKLTGGGIAGAVGKCLWGDVPVDGEFSGRSPGKGPWWENDLIWEEYDVPEGYRTAVCRFRQEIHRQEIYV